MLILTFVYLCLYNINAHLYVIYIILIYCITIYTVVIFIQYRYDKYIPHKYLYNINILHMHNKNYWKKKISFYYKKCNKKTKISLLFFKKSQRCKRKNKKEKGRKQKKPNALGRFWRLFFWVKWKGRVTFLIIFFLY